MPEKQKKTIRELTLMLMYLTSWEERDTPEMRAVKKKELEKYPLVRRCWKGYDHDLLNKLSEEGLINAAGRTYPALITPEGEAEARKLLAQYGIDTEERRRCSAERRNPSVQRINLLTNLLILLRDDKELHGLAGTVHDLIQHETTNI